MERGIETLIDSAFISGIINKTQFIEMPIESRTLFFYLIFNCDQEGFYPSANLIREALKIEQSYLDILLENSLIGINARGFYYDPFSFEEENKWLL